MGLQFRTAGVAHDRFRVTSRSTSVSTSKRCVLTFVGRSHRTHQRFLTAANLGGADVRYYPRRSRIGATPAICPDRGGVAATNPPTRTTEL